MEQINVELHVANYKDDSIITHTFALPSIVIEKEYDIIYYKNVTYKVYKYSFSIDKKIFILNAVNFEEWANSSKKKKKTKILS